MANVKHSLLTGSDIHEPKAITTAAAGGVYVGTGSNTGAFKTIATDANATQTTMEPKSIDAANAGEVYTADGVGGGAWEAVGGSVFGDMHIVNNTTPLAVTAAADTTLNTDSQYIKIDTGIWTTGVTDGVTFNANGYLEALTAGTYEVSFWTSFDIDTITTFSAVKFSIDDTNTTLSPRKLSRLSGSGGDIGNMAASGYVDLVVGSKVSMWVAADKTVNATFRDAGLTIILLKEA